MATIEGFRVKNYRSLKDVTIGRLWANKNGAPLTPLTAVIGKNGSGKSSLLDAFGFLADCLKLGVEAACDVRGGFHALRSQGQTGAIEFKVSYRESDTAGLITYQLCIDLDLAERPFVAREILGQSLKESPLLLSYFLVLSHGKGVVWRGEDGGKTIHEDQQGLDLDQLTSLFHRKNDLNSIKQGESVELDDKRKLGISTFGSLKQHPHIVSFRHFIEGWYLNYFSPDAARNLSLAGAQKHLNTHGDNLGNVVQFMEREHPQQFRSILQRIATKIPGIETIDTEKTSDGRLLLRFNNSGFVDPFYAQQMSGGTLKVFAYLLLLEDPSPPPFLCIEEPENGLYHKLLESLVQEFRHHATNHRGGSQIFITTHQPYLVDALDPEEVWILEKGTDGFSHIRRASDDPLVVNMVKEGLPLGGLWYSDYLEKD